MQMLDVKRGFMGIIIGILNSTPRVDKIPDGENPFEQTLYALSDHLNTNISTVKEIVKWIDEDVCISFLSRIKG